MLNWFRVHSMKGVQTLMLIAVAAVFCGLTASSASAQECSFAVSGTDFSAHLYPAVDARTTEVSGDACGLYSVQTEAWIDGAPWASCLLGSPYSPTVCYALANIQARAIPEFGLACGGWTGISRHWAIYTPTGGWTQLNNGADKNTHLRPEICKNTSITGECDAEFEYWDEQLQTCVTYNTPIIIPLTKSQAIKLTGVAGGVGFDFDGDGSVERTAWTAPGSRLAFLAIDRNGNGSIDSGSELFGNHTVPGEKLGFDALRILNEQMGGSKEIAVIDSTQPIFDKLLLWEDSNHNGVSEPYELQPATNLVARIGLGLMPTNRRDRFGNSLKFRGFAHVRTAPGQNRPTSAKDDLERQINIYDVLFVR